MDFMKRVLLAGTVAVCALTMSVTSLAATTSDVYYCNGYAHTNGHCTGHTGHHSLTGIRSSAATGTRTPVGNGASSATGTRTPAATIAPSTPTTVAPAAPAPNYYGGQSSYYRYGGHHSGGHGYYHH